MEEASNPEEDWDWVGGRSRGTLYLPTLSFSHSRYAMLRYVLGIGRKKKKKKRKKGKPNHTDRHTSIAVRPNENAGISSTELDEMKKMLRVEERPLFPHHSVPPPPPQTLPRT